MRGLQCLLQLLTKLARGSVHHCFILVLGSAPNHRELHRAARAARGRVVARGGGALMLLSASACR
jgi:hypothetical protein